MPDFVSTEEIIQLARRRVHQGVWDYLVGGSESETTLRRNRLAFDRLAFRPRVLRDVSSIDTSTEFLGHKLRIPVMLAPVGSLQVFDPGGGAAATQAAAEFGIMHVLSSVTEPALEETASCVDYPKMFQLYVHGDWKWIEDIIGRVVEADYKALCVTVDVQHYSRRERVMVERWVQPTRRAPPRPVLWRGPDVGSCRPHPRPGGAALHAQGASRRWRTHLLPSSTAWTSSGCPTTAGGSSTTGSGPWTCCRRSSRPWTGAQRSSWTAACCAAATC